MPKATRPDDGRLRRTSVLVRLLAKVDREHGDPPWPGMTPCWPFMGGLSGKGYGKLRDDEGHWSYAHRIALAAALGRPLAAGMLACHRCDRKDCCRPSHLYEGSRSDNEEDKWYAMREPRGDRIFGVDEALVPVAD